MPEIPDGQLERTILALRWMTIQLKWQFEVISSLTVSDENKTAFAQTNKDGYSDKLKDAISLLAEFEAKQGSDGREIPAEHRGFQKKRLNSRA